MRLWVAALLAMTLGGPISASAKEYVVDSDHTAVSFKVRHLFSYAEGRFDRFDGTIEFDPNALEATSVQGTIDVSSINTNVAERDKHLRSGDFFDAAKYPKIEFRSTKVTDVDTAKKTGKIHGDLTIHGVTKPVVLDAAFLGEGKDPWGNQKAGFSAKTTVNRKDFGLNWNQALETGGVLVGEDVEISLNVEAKVE